MRNPEIDPQREFDLNRIKIGIGVRTLGSVLMEYGSILMNSDDPQCVAGVCQTIYDTLRSGRPESYEGSLESDTWNLSELAGRYLQAAEKAANDEGNA